MILISMAWVLIGEQVFNFRDYAVGAGVILVVVVLVPFIPTNYTK